MLVNVCYKVPVIAVVDTKTARIVRVVVDDEEIGAPEYCETAKDCTLLPAISEAAGAAMKIAETEEWPGWEFGF